MEIHRAHDGVALTANDNDGGGKHLGISQPLLRNLRFGQAPRYDRRRGYLNSVANFHSEKYILVCCYKEQVIMIHSLLHASYAASTQLL